MNLQDWKLLVELHQYKSISKASETLFVSQPALTRRLKQIEEEFSTIITLRSSKGIVFTPQGERLVEYSRDMLKQYNQIVKSMETSENIVGTLRIASSLTQTQFFLPALLQEFSQLHPGVSFEVETNFSASCMKALNTHKVQIALFRGEHYGTFEKELLATHSAYIVYHQPFSLSDLPNMPYISFESDHSSTNIRESWWYDHFDTAPYTAMTTKNVNVCYEMVRHGLGYGIFLNSEIWAHNNDLCYQQLFYKNQQPVIRNDWIGYRKESLKLEPVSSFIRYTLKYSQKCQQNQPSLDIRNF